MDAPRPHRNRIHVDISVPHDHAEARVAAVIAGGGHLVTDRNAPAWWVLADAEGNEAPAWAPGWAATERIDRANGQLLKAMLLMP